MIRLLTSTYKYNKEKAEKLAKCVGLMDAPCGMSSIVNCGSHSICKHCDGSDYEVASDLRRLFLYVRKIALAQMETADEWTKTFEELASRYEKENYEKLRRGLKE